MLISGAVVFGVLAFLAVRSGRSTITAAIAAGLFGFLLASTSLAPDLTSFLDSVASTLHRIAS